MNRVDRSEEVYERLFGPRDFDAPDPHPEFMQILRSLIFGEVFDTGGLDDATRELITVTVLGAVQALPQLTAHAHAALRVGVTPVELMEAMYSLAGFIGFPRTLNAVATVTKLLQERGEELPLPQQGTVTESDRHERGLKIQRRLYGDEIAAATAGLPEPYDQAVPNFLTDFLFGDLWTRTGLDLATRELLGVVVLSALGFSQQLPPHVRGAAKAGNSVETILAALVQAFPYMGYPAAINAIRVVQQELLEG